MNMTQSTMPQKTVTQSTVPQKTVMKAGLWLMMATLLVVGCAGSGRAPQGRLDTPEHHARRGLDFIDQERWQDAEASFDRALGLDQEYGPAQAGKGVVSAKNATSLKLPPAERERLSDISIYLATQGVKNSNGEEQERLAHSLAIQVYQIGKPNKDWLDSAEDHFEEALDSDPNGQDPRPHLLMGRAYRDAFQMEAATSRYNQVLTINRGLTGVADRELALVQKIRRAAPGTRHGKTVAFDSAVTRADMAALFIEELQLAKLYQRDAKGRFDNSFKSAGQRNFAADQMVKAPEMTDIANHPLVADIKDITRLGVLGLEPDASHRFHPDENISRAAFALMVEDILVKVTGEKNLKTRFIGQPSPFADVRNDAYFFNAVQTVVTRNLMEPKEKLRGVFAPNDSVAGADALLVIRLLKDELRSLLRN